MNLYTPLHFNVARVGNRFDGTLEEFKKTNDLSIAITEYGKTSKQDILNYMKLQKEYFKETKYENKRTNRQNL